MTKEQSRWMGILAIAACAVFLLGLFSPPIADYDFWWTLKAGQYIAQEHRLPTPDPFAFTTALAKDYYAGESITRHFNLTFEWLAQIVFFSVFSIGGLPGIVLMRAVMLTAFSILSGLVVWRRTGGLYRAIGAALACALVAADFTHDRSYLFTLLFLGALISLLEFRRWLWGVPVLCLVWANCHGGFFLAWIVLGAYSAEAFYLRLRGKADPAARTLWAVTPLSIVVSALNPNGFRVIEVLYFFRTSFLQSKLQEWGPPDLWPPGPFSVLLAAAVGVLIWARERVRPADWILFLAFTAASLTARRNTFLIGFLAPIIIASNLNWTRAVKPRFRRFAPPLVAAAALCGLALGVVRGNFFRFLADEWRFPSGAANFLISHQINGPMFNTYEYGGYLMWRLWPQERVFIDGRALSESVFLDYARILYNHDASDGGRTAQQLLDRYGIQVIVMNTLEYVNGLLYMLAPSLADPSQTAWKLVYNDPQSVIFMRQAPAGVEPLNSLATLDHLEAECDLHIDHEPEYPRCARALGQAFLRIGMKARARRWIGIYLSQPHPPDPEAEQAYSQLVMSR